MLYQNPKKSRDFIFKNPGIGIRVQSRDHAGHCRVVMYMAILTHILQARVLHVLARVVTHVLARVVTHVLARVIMHVHDYYLKTCLLEPVLAPEGLFGGLKLNLTVSWCHPDLTLIL